MPTLVARNLAEIDRGLDSVHAVGRQTDGVRYVVVVREEVVGLAPPDLAVTAADVFGL